MTVTTYLRGHLAVWTQEDPIWRYEDTGEPVSGNERPCKWCGWLPTPEGYDACLGKIPGATSACCGHGAERSYVKWEGKDDREKCGIGRSL